MGAHGLEMERSSYGSTHSAVRNWLYNELNAMIPDEKTEIHSGRDDELFKKWTGHTQSSLDTIWKAEKKYKDENGGQGPTTTTCNAFLGVIVKNARTAGKLPHTGFQSFNLQVEAGWHWYPDGSVQPRTGDMFQYGKKLDPTKAENKNNWFFKHVGIILEISGSTWTTIESGQGGPKMGYDVIKRKGPRPFEKDGLMGFIDAGEFYEGWNG